MKQYTSGTMENLYSYMKFVAKIICTMFFDHEYVWQTAEFFFMEHKNSELKFIPLIVYSQTFALPRWGLSFVFRLSSRGLFPVEKNITLESVHYLWLGGRRVGYLPSTPFNFSMTPNRLPKWRHKNLICEITNLVVIFRKNKVKNSSKPKFSI